MGVGVSWAKWMQVKSTLPARGLRLWAVKDKEIEASKLRWPNSRPGILN